MPNVSYPSLTCEDVWIYIQTTLVSQRLHGPAKYITQLRMQAERHLLAEGRHRKGQL